MTPKSWRDTVLKARYIAAIIGCYTLCFVGETIAARLAVLAVDTSKSMREEAKWDRARWLADNVLQQDLGEGDTCFLLTFQDRADEVGTYSLPEREAALKAALELSVAAAPRTRREASFLCVRDFSTKFFKEHANSSSDCALFLITDGAPSLKSKALQAGLPRGEGSVRLYAYTYLGETSGETPPPPVTSLHIQPSGLSIRNGRWDFGSVSSGEACNPKFRLSAEPPTSTNATLTVEISDLSSAGVPIPGQSVEYSIDSGGQNGRSIAVAVLPDGADFAVSVHPPETAWNWKAEEEIAGRLAITATNQNGDELAEWAGDFVLVVGNDMTNMLVLGAVLLAISVLGTALLWQGCAPKAVTLREVGRPDTGRSFTVKGGGGIPLGGGGEGFVLSGIPKPIGTLRRRGLGWVVYPEAGAKVDDRMLGTPKPVQPNVPITMEAEDRKVEWSFVIGKSTEAEKPEESTWR